MSKEIRFEEKYKNLKSKFMESVDLAFRLGIEQGQQMAQMDQMAQQQQQAEMQAAQQAQIQGAGGQPGAPGQEQGQPGASPEQQNPMGSELDQHLNELEGLMGKSEVSAEDFKKSIAKIKGLRDLKKSVETIKGIGLALHTPKYQRSVQASHNLTDTAKNSLHIQQKIVDDVFNAWDEESKVTSNKIADTLKIEGIIK